MGACCCHCAKHNVTPKTLDVDALVAADDPKAFVAANVDVDALYDGWTPLMWCLAHRARNVALYIVSSCAPDLRVMSARVTHPMRIPFGESVQSVGMTVAAMCAAMVTSCARACRVLPPDLLVFCCLLNVPLPAPLVSVSEECPVCFENITDPCASVCKHSVCTGCASQFKRAQCPLCQKPYPTSVKATVLFEASDIVVSANLDLHAVCLHGALRVAEHLFSSRWSVKVYGFRDTDDLSRSLFQAGARHLSTLYLV